MRYDNLSFKIYHPSFIIHRSSFTSFSYLAIMFQKIRKWKWIISAILCFVLLNTLPSSFIEKYYANGFFLVIRNFLDNTFGKVPFPSYYIFIAFLLFIITKWFLHFFREKPQPFLQRVFKIFSFVGFLITWFFIFWGFNYGRVSLEDKLNITIQPLTTEQLTAETESTIEHIAQVRNSIQHDTNSIPQIVFINNIEDNSRDALNVSLDKFGYSYSHKIRGRFVFDDMFLVFSIGGQYLPFVGEGNVDDAVYYAKKPFYLMHEMAHGNGFTEEADCNFLAYVSCVNSKNLSLEYCGELNYLSYLLPELRSRDSVAFNTIKTTLPTAIRRDLETMKKYYEKHTFKSSFIGDAMNNIYLKIMGVQDGVKNYDKMLLLVYAWKYNKK